MTNYINSIEFYKNAFFKKNFYFLIGNETKVTQEITEKIILNCNKKNFNKIKNFYVEDHKIFNKIFYKIHEQDFLEKKQIIIIKTDIKSFSIKIKKKIQHLVSIKNKNIICIIFFEKNILNNKNYLEMLKTNQDIVFIKCNKPKINELYEWIKFKSKKLKIKISKINHELIIKNYIDNFTGLINFINIISLIWPNKKINRKKIQQIIECENRFTYSQWINYIIKGNQEKTIKILQYFKIQNYSPVILIRVLQNFILNIINLKRKTKYCIYENYLNKNILTKNNNLEEKSKKINNKKLYNSIKLISLIELKIKRNFKKNVWLELINLSLTLC
ncbi:DNA polymerase III subunit delta [Buchnera aphidicola (Neophyllaphis podocarpi)]